MIKEKRQGFTLAEALITLVIMGLVMAATIPIVRTASNQPAEAPWKYIVRGNLINNNAIYTAAENNSLSVVGDSRIPYDENISEGDLPTIFASQINPKLTLVTQSAKDANPVISRHLIDFYEKTGTNKHKSIGKISFDKNFNLAIGTNTLDTTVRKATADVALPNDTEKWCELGANAEGAANTAVGQYSMAGAKKAIEKDTSNSYRKLTGIGNTALGAMSLQSITSGAWNVAVGTYSMKNMTNGDINIAVGANSMRNVLGSGNIAIGTSTLMGDATESTDVKDNTAIGHYAMQQNTTGHSNVVIGNNTSKANTTGHSNVVIGINNLQNNQTGAHNVAIGYQVLSGEYLTQVDNTTAIGSEALHHNSSGKDNTAIGYQSLYSNVSGSQNTGVGNFALQANKTGGDNTALGFYALANNFEAVNNTAIGSKALETNTAGTNNTAVGALALNKNTTSNNTAIGSSALTNNTSGTNNSAIGYTALQNNTTGNNNTAVGYSTLTNNTTGVENVAIGARAINNGSGSYNSAVGVAALSANTGSENTAMGHYTLQKNTSGSYNTAYGSHALLSNTSGSKNTAIGYEAISGNTTGSGNVAIGYKVASGDGSNKLYIGNELHTGTNALIYGNMEAQELTINGTAYINNSKGKSQIVTKADLANLTANLTTGNISVPATVISDARLKNISGDSTAGLKEITQLKVKNFTYKNDKKKTPHVGVIAQDLQKVFPNSVFQDGLSKYLKISREEIFWACVNAIKELNDKIQDVIAKITGLDEKIRLLEARNKMNEDKITNLEHQNKLYEERLQAIEFQIAKQLEKNTKTQNKLEDIKVK